MVFCIIAWVVFGVLGIFSAKYRKYARESFECFFRTLTLRKCTTGFDEKVKMKVAVRLSNYSPSLGNFVRNYFQAVSWVFVIAMLASAVYGAYGVYNFVTTGNCEGTAYGFCALSPETYGNFWNSPSTVKPIVLGDAPSMGPESAPVHVIEVGCFTCPYTRQTEPLVQQLLQDYNGQIRFSFKYFPLPTHPYSLEAAESAECAREQGKFWEYKTDLFLAETQCSEQHTQTVDLRPLFSQTAQSLDLNLEQFQQCLDSNKFLNMVEQSKQDAISAGIYGTPTFYINEKVLVAPKSYDELKNAVQEALQKQ
ncbi:MAG: thioredoxin domain-containing protein [Candidatus Diapherotrites archaeon]